MTLEHFFDMESSKKMYNDNNYNICLEDFISTADYLLSYPAQFIAAAPDNNSPSISFQVLLDFVNLHKEDHPNFQYLLFPTFLNIYMNFKDEDSKCKFFRTFVSKLPKEAQDKVNKYFSDATLLRNLLISASEFKFKVYVTSTEREILVDFLSHSDRVNLKRFLINSVSLKPIFNCLYEFLELPSVIYKSGISVLLVRFPVAVKSLTSTLTGNCYYPLNNVMIRHNFNDGESRAIVSHKKLITTFDISSTENVLASADLSGDIKVWSDDKSATILSSSIPTSLQFAPFGGVFAIGNISGGVELFELKNLKMFRCFDCKTKVIDIKFHPNMAYIFVSTISNKIYMWDIRKVEIVRVFKSNHYINCFDISPSGSLLAFFDSSLKIVDILHKETLAELHHCQKCRVRSLHFSFSSDIIYSICFNGHLIASDISKDIPQKKCLTDNQELFQTEKVISTQLVDRTLFIYVSK